MTGEANPVVVAGVHLADLPVERDHLWDFADTWINAHGAAMDTWDREHAWAAIVSAINPDWVVGLTERRRLQYRDERDRILAKLAQHHRAHQAAQETWPAPLPSRPYPGQQIRLMFEGELSEPFTVTAHQGRTESTWCCADHADCSSTTSTPTTPTPPEPLR